MVTDNLTTATINGESISELFPPFVKTKADDLTLWNNGQGNIGSNTTYGESALRSNTTGFDNTAIGAGALSFNIIGNGNTAVGSNSLISNTSDDNTALGSNALNTNNLGSANTAVGVNALYSNTTGLANTAIGLDALLGNTTGDNNTALGISTDSGNFDASIILGRDATATASNQFVSGSVSYPAGAVSVAAAAQTRTWDVIINGVAHKILLA
jgi:hypothetical protein